MAEEPPKMLGSQQDLGNVPYLFGSRDLWASKQTLVSTRYLAQRLWRGAHFSRMNQGDPGQGEGEVL